MTLWTPFSESNFWLKQSDYYNTQTSSIWEKTPHTVTNNAFIAKKLAQICEAISPQSPTIEVGSGIGEFAFHYCKSRKKPFQFICTDYATRSVKTLESLKDFHPWRYAYIHFHQLDCLNYKSLPTHSNHFPIFIFNYVFDTLPHDAYIKLSNNHIQTVLTSNTQCEDPDGLIHLSANNKLAYRTEKKALPPHIEDYIKSYWEAGQQLTLPTGALRSLAHIRKHHPKALILFNDKTCQSPDNIAYQDGFSLLQEGSVSCTVNTHAIKHLLQPDFMIETPIDSSFDLNISTGLLGWGFSNHDVSHIHNVWKAHQQNTIYDYALINRELALEHSQISYPMIKRWLTQYDHDPYLFLNCTQNLYHHIHTGSSLLHQDVHQLLLKIKATHFSLNERLIPALSSCYRVMNDLDSAEVLMRTYALSQPDNHHYHKEMAHLQFMRTHHQEALAHINQARLHQPECKQMHALEIQVNQILSEQKKTKPHSSNTTK